MKLHILALGAAVAFVGPMTTAAVGLTVPSKPVMTQASDAAGVMLVRGGPGKGGNSGSGNAGSGNTGSGNSGSGGGKPGKGGGVDDGAGHNGGDDHGVHAPGHK
ncbi:hypothetical protein ABB55_18620 [Prosthecomicrobium hirschii]|uniref:PE-PGRS family protein n=1 Tax=Prosthecodimorpha hirschii TaxID=665126 RepID=A0A0P6WH21_9HYPH|nr:hypothetical protein [Prosthecomicrobium hirschii]KPL53976.1 hypothetical protein ABB55_18620 [Prosthecomicrobium hirschii]